MKETTKLYVQVGGGELRPVNAPKDVIQSVICLPELEVRPRRDVPRRAKRCVLETLMSVGVPLTYRQLAELTGYSVAYLYNVIGTLIYENKVIGERRGGRIYRYRIARNAKMTTHRRMKRKAASPTGLETLGNGDGTSSGKIAQKAARKVLRTVINTKTTMDDKTLLSTRLYSKWYLKKAIRVLVSGGYLKIKTVRGVRYYKPTIKAKRLASLL